MSHKKYLMVVGGPTASGKTGFAIRLARHFNTQIVSCDSRQFFREMNIGTAKPTAEELALATHHFIGHLPITRAYSVGAYEKEARKKLDELFRERDIVVLVGGSGLYLKALCEGLDHFPEVPLAMRKEVEDFYRREGLAALQMAVQQADPVYFDEADQQNPHRLIRALAVCRVSGKPFSSFRKKHSGIRPFTPIYIQMHWPRSMLYERINQRVDRMIEQGLLEETRQLLPYRRHTALQTVGYQEMFAFLDGLHDWETTVENIRRNSRRYAKRQLTWMRRDGCWKHYNPGQWEEALSYILSAMNNNWQWEEHKFPLPSSLASHYQPDEKGKNNCRLLVLNQDKQPIASILIRSYKRFERLEPPHFKPALPSATVQHLLHEAICRCEDAPVLVVLPAGLFTLPKEWGFLTASKEQWPAGTESSDLRHDNNNIGYWREALP